MCLQVNTQLGQAAQAVLAIKQAAYKQQTAAGMQQHQQHAVEVLAAQIPRLELYASMKVQIFVKNLGKPGQRPLKLYS